MAATAAVADHRVQIWRAWTGVFAKLTSCHNLFACKRKQELFAGLGPGSSVCLPRISSPHFTACLRPRESKSCLLVRSRFISLPRIGQFSTGSQEPAIGDMG